MKENLTCEEAKVANDISKHIFRVQIYMYRVIRDLMKRMAAHDRTKLCTDEIHGYAKIQQEMGQIEYGSDEYFKNLEILRETLNAHYRMNRHHPEHYNEGIDGMNLIDLMEMICDWVASSELSKDGNPFRSLEFQRDRFKIDDQLYKILENTIKVLNHE
ncbi:MAG: DUF5662 family protein [Candidatus Nitrosotenuis sp.]